LHKAMNIGMSTRTSRPVSSQHAVAAHCACDADAKGTGGVDAKGTSIAIAEGPGAAVAPHQGLRTDLNMGRRRA